MKFNKKENFFHYTEEQKDRRLKDIPGIEEEKTKTSKAEFIEEDSTLKVESHDSFVPASIEYLTKKQKKLIKVKKDPKPEKKFVKGFKEHFLPELEKDQTFEFETPNTKLSSLSKEPEISKEELESLDLASEDKINELFDLHMRFYSLLSEIQDTSISSDFRSAYDIQDRISYVLDHQSLLSKKLVERLIYYLRDIANRLKIYGEELKRKRIRYTELNHRVSVLKEYKYKTDESFKFLSENKEIVEKEVEKSLNKLKKV